MPEPRPRRPVVSARARLLRTLPTGIAVLWVAGLASFRNLPLQAIDYIVLFAAALALQIVLGRLRRERPIELPASSNPTIVALFAALITGAFALIVGGTIEALAADEGTSVPWSLRTLWHGACAFGAGYCRFLARLSMATTTPR